MNNFTKFFLITVDVPGCDAYREYLFTFMREQPIWLSIRFWNTAFYESMQNERDHRVLAKQKKQERRKARQKAKADLDNEHRAQSSEPDNEEKVLQKTEISTSSSSHHSHTNKIKRERSPKTVNEAAADIDKEMENIAFRQLT